MIAPDRSAAIRAERRFDLLSAGLIGVIAVLAAVLAIVQVDTGQRAARAQMQSARLAADLSARLQTSGVATQEALTTRQASLSLSAQGLTHQAAGTAYGDEGAIAVGEAERAASTRLQGALRETVATSGGAPLDSYSSGMLKATIDQLWQEVAEQNRQVDLAEDAGHRNSLAILGLSFLALGGVLVGLAAVLREGRAGWFSLLFAATVTCGAGAVAVLAVF